MDGEHVEVEPVITISKEALQSQVQQFAQENLNLRILVAEYQQQIALRDANIDELTEAAKSPRKKT